MDARTVTPAFEQLVGALSADDQRATREAIAGLEIHAEACWHGHASDPELVVGLERAPPERLVELTRSIVPAQADTVARWLAALPGATLLGFKLGNRGPQMYARGRFTAAVANAAFQAAGITWHGEVATNLLALLAERELAMVGLELDGERADGALYASVPRVKTTAAALGEAFRFLVRVVAPDQVALWDEVAPAMFDAPADEVVYVSMSSAVEWPWAKLDVGVRQLRAAAMLADRFGTGSVDATIDRARALGGDRWSHVGARFGSSFGPVFYLPIAGDRE